MTQFDTVPSDVVAAGEATDASFDRTVETLERARRNPRVVAEITADQFPREAVDLLAGVKDAARLLEGLPVDVEGTPTAEREKLSGRKQEYRTDDGGHHVGLAGGDEPEDGEALLEPIVRDGELVREFRLAEVRDCISTESDELIPTSNAANARRI